RTTCPRCSSRAMRTTTRTLLRRCGWRGPRSSCAARTSPGCSATTVRRQCRRSHESCPVRRRSRSSSRGDARSTRSPHSASSPRHGTSRLPSSPDCSGESEPRVHVTGWIRASTEPGLFDGVPTDTELDWEGGEAPFRGSDEEDHWFRVLVDAGGPAPTLELPGLATLCDVYVDGDRVLRSESMFLSHELELSPGRHELAVCARALSPVLAESRRPRARWRTRVVPNGNLRWIRTSFYGRAPGFAAGPPLVGPWRPVELLEQPRLRADVRTNVDGHDGVIEVHAPASAGSLEVTTGWGTTQLAPGGGPIRVTAPEPWWPHTHGDPVLHEVRVRAMGAELVRRVGF